MSGETTGLAAIAISIVALYYMLSKDVKDVAASLAAPGNSVVNWLNTPIPQPADVAKGLGPFNPFDSKNWITSPDNWIWKGQGNSDPVQAIQPGSGVIRHSGYPDLVVSPGDFVDPKLVRSGSFVAAAPAPSSSPVLGAITRFGGVTPSVTVPAANNAGRYLTDLQKRMGVVLK